MLLYEYEMALLEYVVNLTYVKNKQLEILLIQQNQQIENKTILMNKLTANIKKLFCIS